MFGLGFHRELLLYRCGGERKRFDSSMEDGGVHKGVMSLIDETGLYQSQSEVLREGLRLLKERSELRKEIAMGARQARQGKSLMAKQSSLKLSGKVMKSGAGIVHERF